MNPFATLGIEPKFLLDSSLLAERQRELSKALHPDRFVGRPSGERRQALNCAIEVNEAHRALKNPITRAEALLELLGLRLPEGQEPPARPELLMEMMERREELREAGQAEDVNRIQTLAAGVRRDEDKVSAALHEAFAHALTEHGAGRHPASEQIHQNLASLRYFRRFFDEADALLDELD